MRDGNDGAFISRRRKDLTLRNQFGRGAKSIRLCCIQGLCLLALLSCAAGPRFPQTRTKGPGGMGRIECVRCLPRKPSLHPNRLNS